MSDQVKIKLFIGTGYANADHKDEEYIDRAEWEAMSDGEQEAYLEQAALDFLHNHIEYSAYVEEDN